MKATQIKLSAATMDAIKANVSKDLAARNSGVKVIDGLYADGIKPEMMFAPKKDEDRTFYTSLETSVVAGFTAPIQALLKKETKTLKEDDKKKKRYWQQQIGSKIKDYRNALAKRFESGESDGAQDDKSSWEATLRKELATRIAQAQKKEATKIKDIAAFIKDLQSALARIPANA